MLAGAEIAPAGAAPARITSAKLVAGSIAPYCEVRGYVAPQVKFELRLPTQNWMQRLMFSGCGGFCGTIDFRIPASDGCSAIENGEFALVTSDLGHDSRDTVWAARNPQGRIDYGHRAVHVVAVTAKAIVARFYGRPQAYAYFNGCSDGGREALMEVQRYPDDFNGVIAGAPVINDTANNSIFHGWSAQHLRRADGAPMFTPADLAVLHAAALEACDSSGDGVQDGVVGDPLNCRFEPGTVTCRDGHTTGCLSGEQVQAARALYSGPRDPSGKALYYGRPIGSELSWNIFDASAFAESFIRYMTTEEPQPFDLASVSYDATALAHYNAQAGVFNALNPDIREFQRKGGKLIMWHGWGDAGVPPMSSIEYYRAVRRTVGAGTDAFVKLYMLPGVGHCGFGEGPDMINLVDAMIAWAEDGVPPGAVQASRRNYGRTVQTRPIYPFPMTARYTGTGDRNSATAFVGSRQ
ncbi:MAG: tannase/feruloyl esterase family alpha/beta hydrolase [Sphingomonas bacterium]